MRAERLRQIALVAALLVPLGLLHSFVLAEICIGVVDVLFLADCARRRDFAWARQGWVVLALLWWVWLLLCSTPLPLAGFGSAGWGLGFVQVLVIIRQLLYPALLPPVLALLTRPGRAARLGGLALAMLGVLTSVLIGQRMGVVLT